MADAGSEEHRERSRRAQRLSDDAREQAGGERAAAERSERLIEQDADPALTDIHRQAAALHRQAQQHYERAADFQRLHADHERHAAEQAEAVESPGPDPGIGDAAADRRDGAADEREQFADLREQTADARELRADDRERLQDERERRSDEASGNWTPQQRERLAQAKAALRRLESRLARQADGLDREDARAARDQAIIDRESAASGEGQRPPGNPPTDAPSDGTG